MIIHSRLNYKTITLAAARVFLFFLKVLALSKCWVNTFISQSVGTQIVKKLTKNFFQKTIDKITFICYTYINKERN